MVSILRRFGAEISPGVGDGVLDAHVNLRSNRNAFRDVIRSASATLRAKVDFASFPATRSTSGIAARSLESRAG